MPDQNQIELLKILILPLTLGIGKLLFSRWLKTTTRRNQAQEWLLVAEGVVTNLRRVYPSRSEAELFAAALQGLKQALGSVAPKPNTLEQLVSQALHRTAPPSNVRALPARASS